MSLVILFVVLFWFFFFVPLLVPDIKFYEQFQRKKKDGSGIWLVPNQKIFGGIQVQHNDILATNGFATKKMRFKPVLCWFLVFLIYQSEGQGTSIYS